MREREREFLQVRKMFYLSYQRRENDIFSSFFPPLFSMPAKIPLTKPIVKPSKVLIPYPSKASNEQNFLVKLLSCTAVHTFSLQSPSHLSFPF